MQRLFVIDRDFFTGPNIAQRKKQHVAVKRPHVCVRLAAMVDVVRAITATTAVYAEPSVNVTDAQDAALACALLRFQIVNSLAGIFSDLLSTLELNSREAAFAVDLRFADGEAVSKFHHGDCTGLTTEVTEEDKQNLKRVLLSLIILCVLRGRSTLSC